MNFLHSGNKVINSDDLGGAVGLSAHAGVASIESVERSDFGGGLDFVIISEFSEGESCRPVFFTVVREGADVLFNFLISTFGLTIGLRVESGGETSLDTQEALQFRGELGCKLRASIRNDRLWKAMMFPHVIAVEHGKSGAVKSVGDGEGVNLLSETIDDGENSVVTIGGVKACDKVDRDVFPGGSGDWIGNEFTRRGKVEILGSLAANT